MSRKIVRAPAMTHRRQQIIAASQNPGKAVTRLGEAVGGAAAVFCCCPCGLANIMYLTIYKLPVSLCRQALSMKQSRRRKIADKEQLFGSTRRGCACGCCDDVSFRVHPSCCDDEKMVDESFVVEKDKEVVELEKEMWDMFYSSGFWRSMSQKESSFSSSLSSLSSSHWVITS